MTACQLLRQQQQSSLSLPHGSYIYDICPSGNGDDALAAVSSDNSLRRFDKNTLQLLPDGIFKDIHPGKNGGVTCIHDIPDGSAGANGKNLLATAGRDGTVKLWDVRDTKKQASITFTTGKQVFFFSYSL